MNEGAAAGSMALVCCGAGANAPSGICRNRMETWMTTTQRWLPLFALALALGACSKNEPADTAAAPTAAPAAATADAPAAAAVAAVADEISDMSGEIALTGARMARYYVALDKLATLQKQNPELEELAMDANESTEQFVARIEREPRIAAALAASGMSALEYARTSEALVSSLFAQGMMEAGLTKELPPDANKANIEFVKAHQAEIEAKMKAAGDDAG